MKITLGIDNGSSGTLGFLDTRGKCLWFCETPVIKVPDFNTSSEVSISRLDPIRFSDLLAGMCLKYNCDRVSELDVVMERPLKNPRMFAATWSGARCFEAQLVCMMLLGIKPPRVIDSKTWQHSLLPGVQESKKLKAASRDKGCALFPSFGAYIKDHGDADGLLIAHWAWVESQQHQGLAALRK